MLVGCRIMVKREDGELNWFYGGRVESPVLVSHTVSA